MGFSGVLLVSGGGVTCASVDTYISSKADFFFFGGMGSFMFSANEQSLAEMFSYRRDN